MKDQNFSAIQNNVIRFPTSLLIPANLNSGSTSETPATDAMKAESDRLDQVSAYKTKFDWEPIRNLEIRFKDDPIRGGIVFKTAFKLVNAHPTCQQCLYAFEVDTYGRGCVHNCVYCYAKAQLTTYGYWNKPIPVPVDINSIRKEFYTAFETDKKSKWRELLSKRIPIRIGSMSDSFMWMDEKYKVTKEFLNILKFYSYPYIIFTRSDLVARDDYMSLLDKRLCSIQFSISSTNEKLTKKIEPGAPSPARRLNALRKLASNDFWTTVRLNPFFPIHPDGYFTNPDFKWEGEVPHFPFSSFDMVDEIADTGVPAILAGVVRLSGYSLNQISSATGYDLREFFGKNTGAGAADRKYSDTEIRYYYEKIKERCDAKGVQFTTCYIGNGEDHFWKDQDLWANKKDCCNVKNRVESFKSDSREILFEERLRHSSGKTSTPNDQNSLHSEIGKDPEHIKVIKSHQAEPR